MQSQVMLTLQVFMSAKKWWCAFMKNIPLTTLIKTQLFNGLKIKNPGAPG